MTERYSYRRSLAVLVFAAAVSWFALIGFVVSVFALANWVFR